MGFKVWTRLRYPPPYRETPVTRPLSHCVPVVSQTIAATPPPLSAKMAYHNPKAGLPRGYRRTSLPLKPIALQAHRIEMVSPIALYSGTLIRGGETCNN